MNGYGPYVAEPASSESIRVKLYELSDNLMPLLLKQFIFKLFAVELKVNGLKLVISFDVALSYT